MSIIKKLKEKLNQWKLQLNGKLADLETLVMGKLWVIAKLEKLYGAIRTLLDKHAHARRVRLIDELIASSNLYNAHPVAVKTIAMNVLVDQPSDPSSSVKTELLIAITIRTAITVLNEVGAIAGVQPMQSPIGKVYSMEYLDAATRETLSDAELCPEPLDLNSPNPLPRKFSLAIISKAIESHTKRLQVSWTFGLRDLKAFHGLDIEAEIAKAIVSEISYEILSNVLHEIVATSPHVELSFALESPLPASQRLSINLTMLASDIARTTRRGSGNFIVCSPLVVSLLQACPESVFSPAIEGSFKGPNNFTYAGILNGVIRVYCYIWEGNNGAGTDRILMGYKGGNGETDAGYIFAPYVLISPSGVVVNPVTFQPQQQLMTRSGSLFHGKNYYRVLDLKDLEFC